MAENNIPAFLLERAKDAPAGTRGKVGRSFLDKGISHLGNVIKTSYVQWELASREGLFQGLDARVKLLFLVSFVVLVSLKKTLLPEAGIFLFVFVLAARRAMPGRELEAPYFIYIVVIYMFYIYTILLTYAVATGPPMLFCWPITY